MFESSEITNRRHTGGRGRPRVLAILPAFIPSTTLMVVKPLSNLHREGHIVADITLDPWVSARQMDRADVIVFARNTNGALLDLAIASGKPIIYNLDDNLLDLPPAYRHLLGSKQQEELKRFLASANLVRAYSETLRNCLLPLNPRVESVQCAVDWRLVPAARPERKSRKVSIVYATSRWRQDDLAALFLEDLRRLLEVYQDRVEVFFWGYHPPELHGHPSVTVLNYVPNYDKFFKRFATTGFDIGLAPLSDDSFHQAKCHNKFREYAASRIAGIYSDVSVYSSIIENESSGLLVSNRPRAWLEAMSRLIEDEALRYKISSNAFQIARTNYTYENDEDVWLRHIKNVAGFVPAASGIIRTRSEVARPHNRERLGILGMARRIVSRGWLLLKVLGKEGPVQFFQWARLYFHSVAELCRIRMTLALRPDTKHWSNLELGKTQEVND